MSASLPPDPPADEPHDPRDPYSGVTTYVYDSQGLRMSIDSGDGRGPVPATPAGRLFRWEHLPEKRLFGLTELYYEKTEYWRDNPTRYLVVEVDPSTGTIEPVTKRGKPVYLLLCREERETR